MVEVVETLWLGPFLVPIAAAVVVNVAAAVVVV